MPNIYKEPIVVPEPPVPAPPELPKDFGPAYDVKNAIYLNDYRNRFPFKVEESDVDYEWAYGSTMDLVFTISDEGQPVIPNYKYVTDVVNLHKSIVDPATKVASLALGDMAYKDKNLYMPIATVTELLTQVLQLTNRAETLLASAGKSYKRLEDKLRAAGAWPVQK